MHPVLRLEEILLNIFAHCHPPTPITRQFDCASPATADLAALARTCRTFKEPALDVLWTELPNLSPLARCLPEASHRIHPSHSWLYSFTRPLEQAEWDILRGYTRRVRSVRDFTRGLDWDSVKTLLNPPMPDPMFPHLRILRWEFLRETFPLMPHFAVESLTSLDINFVFGDAPPFRSFPQSLGDLCPKMRRFRIRMRRPQLDFDEPISTLVRRWTNLQVLYCPYINLDIDALSHLSYTSSLTTLSFTLSPMVADQIVASKFTLPIFKLRDLEISSRSLDTVSKSLARIQLPALRSFTVFVDTCPSKYCVKSFFNALQKICTPHQLLSLRVIQTRSPSSISGDSGRYQLTLDDIRPCMVFDGLRRIDINTDWVVNLNDDDLPELAAAWPDLEYLLINEEWGWKTESGITPNGLLQLPLGTQVVAPLLSRRRHAGLHRYPLSSGISSGCRFRSTNSILSTFFGGIMQRRHADVHSTYWDTSMMSDRLDSEILRRLWEDVFVKAH
ncbi:hypothetical protein JVU11DRAFT_2252 [Chiua virens]|nr:hypothetical protein JVU11DRAFT_2252 [Chiua virens]